MKLNDEKPALTEEFISDYESFVGDAKMAYQLIMITNSRSGNGERWLGALARTFESALISEGYISDVDPIHTRRIREVIRNHLRGLGELVQPLKDTVVNFNKAVDTTAKVILRGLVCHLENVLFYMEQEDRRNHLVFDLRKALGNEIDAVVGLRSEKKVLQELADKDPLTSLDRLHVLERKLKAKSKPGHLFFLDFNGLGVINKVLGDRVGDMSILHAGNILAKVLRDEDMIARKGGDEFVGIFSGENVDPAQASARIIKAFRSIPMVLDLKALNINLSGARGYIEEWNKRMIGFCRAELNPEETHMTLYLSVAIGTRAYNPKASFTYQVGLADQLMSGGKFKSKDRDNTNTINPKDPALKAARDVYVVDGYEPVIFED